MRQFLAVAAAFCLVLLLMGCGPPGSTITLPESGATLQGTVTYGNDRVMAAMVLAQGTGEPVTTFLDDDGRYQLTNVPLGEVRIGVNTAAAKGQAIGKAMAQTKGKAKGPPKILDVPPKYADPATSGLKTTITKGTNTFEIVIPK